jgi:hypothetical protein
MNWSGNCWLAKANEVMKPLFEDTSPEAERILIEGYQKMPAWKKMQCIVDLNQFLRKAQLAQIRQRHPEAGEREITMRLASRWIEPELMRQAFGWDPDKEGY